MASAVNHVSQSFRCRITGIAFGWIGLTTAFGSVVKVAIKLSITTPQVPYSRRMLRYA